MSEKLNVPTFIQNTMCTLPDDAERLRAKLEGNLRRNEKTHIDFTGATDIISRFINLALGELLADFSSEKFDELITIDYNGIDKDDQTIIERSIQSAKEFYANRTSMAKVEQDFIEEEDH